MSEHIKNTSSEGFEERFKSIQGEKARRKAVRMQKTASLKKPVQKEVIDNSRAANINNYLSNLLAVGTNNMDEFIAEEAFPVMTVSDPEGSYWELPFGVRRRNTMKKASERALPKETFLESAKKSYETTHRDDSMPYTEHMALRLGKTLGNGFGDVLAVTNEMQEMLMEGAMLDREERFKDFVSADSNYLSGNVTASAAWSASNADILENIWDNDSTIQSKTGAKMNTRIMNYDTWLKIKASPDFNDRITEGRVIAGQNVKDVQLAIFEALTNSIVYVSEATLNSSPAGVDDSIDWLFPDGFYSFYSPGNITGIRVTAWGMIAACNGLDDFNELGYRTNMVELRETEKNTDKYTVESFDDMNSVTKDYAWKISSVT